MADPIPVTPAKIASHVEIQTDLANGAGVFIGGTRDSTSSSRQGYMTIQNLNPPDRTSMMYLVPSPHIGQQGDSGGPVFEGWSDAHGVEKVYAVNQSIEYPINKVPFELAVRTDVDTAWVGGNFIVANQYLTLAFRAILVRSCTSKMGGCPGVTMMQMTQHLMPVAASSTAIHMYTSGTKQKLPSQPSILAVRGCEKHVEPIFSPPIRIWNFHLLCKSLMVKVLVC